MKESGEYKYQDAMAKVARLLVTTIDGLPFEHQKISAVRNWMGKRDAKVSEEIKKLRDERDLAHANCVLVNKALDSMTDDFNSTAQELNEAEARIKELEAE